MGERWFMFCASDKLPMTTMYGWWLVPPEVFLAVLMPFANDADLVEFRAMGGAEGWLDRCTPDEEAAVAGRVWRKVGVNPREGWSEVQAQGIDGLRHLWVRGRSFVLGDGR